MAFLPFSNICQQTLPSPLLAWTWKLPLYPYTQPLFPKPPSLLLISLFISFQWLPFPHSPFQTPTTIALSLPPLSSAPGLLSYAPPHRPVPSPTPIAVPRQQPCRLASPPRKLLPLYQWVSRIFFWVVSDCWKFSPFSFLSFFAGNPFRILLRKHQSQFVVVVVVVVFQWRNWIVVCVCVCVWGLLCLVQVVGEGYKIVCNGGIGSEEAQVSKHGNRGTSHGDFGWRFVTKWNKLLLLQSL